MTISSRTATDSEPLVPKIADHRFKRQVWQSSKSQAWDKAAGARSIASSAPIVVAAKIKNELRVAALDDAAARLGLVPDMPLATARAMVPALVVIDHDDDADTKTLNAIADWCDRFTPLVALDHSNGLFLDITGCAHLFGGEAALMKTLCQALTRQGFIISTAIAGTAVAARALTHASHGVIVPPEQEAAAVFALPVAALEVDQSIVTGLRRAGLKTIGDVASRSKYEITAPVSVLISRQCCSRPSARAMRQSRRASRFRIMWRRNDLPSRSQPRDVHVADRARTRRGARCSHGASWQGCAQA